MEKTPVIFLIFLISLVIVSAIVADDSDAGPGIKEGEGPMSIAPFGLEPGKDDRFPGGLLTPRKVPVLNDDSEFLADNIEKSEAMAVRLDETLIRLKAQGNDVEELETLIHDYSLLVEDSKMYFEMANVSESNETLATGTSEEAREEYLEKSRNRIIEANMLLKDIFHELRPYLAIHAKVSEGSTLSAEGTGTVVLSGDFDVKMSLSDGRLSYVDFMDDISVKTENMNEATITRVPDMQQELVSYENLIGNVSISGSGFILEVTGEDISLQASGQGEAELFGNGTYYIGKGAVPENKMIWTPPLFEND